MTAQQGTAGENAISIAASPPWANMLSPIPSHTPAFSWAKLVSTPDGAQAALSPELAEAIMKGEVRVGFYVSVIMLHEVVQESISLTWCDIVVVSDE